MSMKLLKPIGVNVRGHPTGKFSEPINIKETF